MTEEPENEAANDSQRPIPTFSEQVRRNAVALISLVVAVTSLAYNTWRNEKTEHQRNLRHAAFMLVEEIGLFQSGANRLVYGTDPTDHIWIDSWGRAITIRSLGRLLPTEVETQASALYDVWQGKGLMLIEGEGKARSDAEAALDAQIERTRETVLTTLRSLD